MKHSTARTAGPRNVGLLGFDGVNGIDLVGPSDAFAYASAFAEKDIGEPAYRLYLIGLDSSPFTSESGLKFVPDRTLADAPALDTLIIPGGEGLRVAKTNAKVAAWIKQNNAGVRRIVSICTGIYGLAPTGLVDGRRVATHWRHAQDVRDRYPLLDVDGDTIFALDGRFCTSAGITAGIDLALVLIEQDLGSDIALAVAREMVVYLRRPGGQSQFAEPLRFQTRATDRFAELATWIVAHLSHDLSIDALAARACLSARQFRRRFIETFDCTPAAYVEELRMTEARTKLLSSNVTVERIAASVGFKSADVFRRAFERKLGITPADYRRGFGSLHTTDQDTSE
jgi:transcriptional regulator GlxA family with amidase domain